MVKRLAWSLLATLLFCSSAHAQGAKSEVEMGKGGTGVQTEIQAENQIIQGVPGFLSNIESALSQLKAGKLSESEAQVQEARTNLARVEGYLSDPDYSEVRLSLEKIDMSLQESMMALHAGRKSLAMQHLTAAARFTKTLKESPIAKLTGTKVTLNLANKAIQQGDYASAGLYLQHSIDYLTAIQEDSKLNQSEIRSLKNDLVIAHNQVILGKMGKKNYLNNLYHRASAATTNAMYQYYDMWTMTPTPWNQQGW